MESKEQFEELEEIEPKVSKIESFIHPSDDELTELDDDAFKSSNGYPPDGQATGTLSVTVTDQNGRPVRGHRVRFSLTHVRPSGNWRSASGLKRIYNSRRGNGAKAENLVNRGVIRVIGTLSSSSAITNSNGVAQVTYRTSHIGTDFNQSSRAREKVTSTLQNGSSRSINLDIGWTGLKKIQTVSGGLRIIGATGQHVHPDLRSFLINLGNSVKNANWPHEITVTAASLRYGGQYPPHFTHKHGLTLDLRPMSTDGERTWAKSDGSSKSNFDFQRTKALISVLKQSGGTVYFNGKNTGGTFKAGHDDHVHVSWLSSFVKIVKEKEITM